MVHRSIYQHIGEQYGHLNLYLVQMHELEFGQRLRSLVAEWSRLHAPPANEEMLTGEKLAGDACRMCYLFLQFSDMVR